MIGRFAHAMALVVVSLGIPCVASASTEPDEPMVEQVRENDARTERRTYVVGRARISTAQELSLGASAFVVRQPVDHDCATACYFRGLLVQLEPGLGGGQIAAGYAVAVAETRTTPRLVRSVHVGYAFKGVLLRTWGDEGSDPPEATWLGGESEFTIVKVNFSLGAFRRVSGESADDRWLVTGGIGWGF